jgi:hypothetical protein
MTRMRSVHDSDEARRLDVQRAVRNALDAGPEVLAAAEPYVVQNCDWEVEHGMQLVLRDGRTVSKVSPYDGHLTNADAFADPKLVGVIYVPVE